MKRRQNTADTKYQTVAADPPWPYNSSRALVGNGSRGTQGGQAEAIKQIDVHDHYRTMSLDDIMALPVQDHVADNAHLYLWTTNSFIAEAHEVARAWGFEPKTIITWGKTQKDDPTKPSMKCGYYYRSATEHIIFAVRGKLRLRGACCPNAFFHPRLPHSVKPDAFYEMAKEQSPGPYLEMFARKNRPGWDCWGDQCEGGLNCIDGSCSSVVESKKQV